MSVERHLARLQVSIETIAESHSRPGPAGIELRDTLSALDEKGRRRVRAFLDRIVAFGQDPEEREAAGRVLHLAAEVWGGEPPAGSADRSDTVRRGRSPR
jgi:hypothetical protein